MTTRSVLLLGDGTRLACQRRVAELAAPDGLAVIWPEAGTGRAECLAAGVEDWLERFSPDLVVFGAGPWARGGLTAEYGNMRGMRHGRGWRGSRHFVRPANELAEFADHVLERRGLRIEFLGGAGAFLGTG